MLGPFGALKVGFRGFRRQACLKSHVYRMAGPPGWWTAESDTEQSA